MVRHINCSSRSGHFKAKESSVFILVTSLSPCPCGWLNKHAFGGQENNPGTSTFSGHPGLGKQQRRLRSDLSSAAPRARRNHWHPERFQIGPDSASRGTRVFLKPKRNQETLPQILCKNKQGTMLVVFCWASGKTGQENFHKGRKMLPFGDKEERRQMDLEYKVSLLKSTNSILQN